VTIPMILQNASFRITERLMSKTCLFIKGYSLKKRYNEVYELLSRPQSTGLETFYVGY
jgi:hypothetical protein